MTIEFYRLYSGEKMYSYSKTLNSKLFFSTMKLAFYNGFLPSYDGESKFLILSIICQHLYLDHSCDMWLNQRRKF